jgi:hypothetical protein
MNDDLLDRWREALVGEWRPALMGTDLLRMKPTDGFGLTLTLRADGTAEWDFTSKDSPPQPPEPPPPFPTRWELSADRVLSIWLPTAPMPDYHMPDWSREQLCYDVLAVSAESLALSDRRFDGESVDVLRRVDIQDYCRRMPERLC